MNDKKNFNINKEEVSFEKIIEIFEFISVDDCIEIENDLISKNVNIFTKSDPRAYLRSCIFNKYIQLSTTKEFAVI